MTDRDKEAVDLLKKVVALNPDFYTAYGDLRMVYERLDEKEKYAEIRQTMLQVFPRYLLQHPDDGRAHMMFAIELAQFEKTEQAKSEAARALELSGGDPVMMYNAACFYARLGEKRLAVETLRNSVTAGFADYEWFKRDPDLESIRDEPEYIDLMKGK